MAIRSYERASRDQILHAVKEREISYDYAFSLLRRFHYCQARGISKEEFFKEQRESNHYIPSLDRASIVAAREIHSARKK